MRLFLDQLYCSAYRWLCDDSLVESMVSSIFDGMVGTTKIIDNSIVYIPKRWSEGRTASTSAMFDTNPGRRLKTYNKVISRNERKRLEHFDEKRVGGGFTVPLPKTKFLYLSPEALAEVKQTTIYLIGWKS